MYHAVKYDSMQWHAVATHAPLHLFRLCLFTCGVGVDKVLVLVLLRLLRRALRATPAAAAVEPRAAPSSADAWIKWPWEQGERSRAHRHGAQHRLDVSGSQMPTNVPRVPSRPAHAQPNGDLLSNYRRGSCVI